MALELAEGLAALGVTDALPDDVLGRLGGNAAKLAGIERNFHHIPRHGALFVFLSVLHQDVGIRVFNIVDHIFTDIDRENPLVAIDIAKNDIL